MGGIECLSKRKPAENQRVSNLLAERQALEPTHSRNIIKLQIADNHI